MPLLGLTVLPLQLGGWLFRGLVFQYLGLSSIGAYLKLYRGRHGRVDRPTGRIRHRARRCDDRLQQVPFLDRPSAH